MNTSTMFRLNLSDWQKALVMAVITGAFLPISTAIQTPNFNITSVSWYAVLILALNGAVVGGVAYLAKNFLSDNTGKVFGKIG